MNIDDLDFTGSIHDFDFTRRAIHNINHIMDSSEFRDMDAETIFHYLTDEMEIVPFCDYLKRFIYELAEMEEPFREVTDRDYTEIIMQSFEEQDAPHFLTPTTKRWSATVKEWLSRDSVTRNTVFLLGFGLGMTDEEVSEFLMKVLKEDDFDFQDPEEVIYWYCFHRGERYAFARKMLDYWNSLTGAEGINPQLWNNMQSAPKMYVVSPEMLMSYLQFLRQDSTSESHRQRAIIHFRELYEKTCQIIRDQYWDEDERKKKKIGPADVMNVIYSGIPMTGSGNMPKISTSILSRQFQVKRLKRQRIHQILNGQTKVCRFDLITLLFFVYASTVEPDYPAERFLQFVDKIDEILKDSGMTDIYPVNPYEAFVLLCMITDDPMEVYSEIWEMSYDGND